MAIQSRLPAFLLTRPAAQSHRFAAALRQRFGKDIAITISPLLAPVFYQPPFPEGPVGALIFTSETGVEAFVRHGARPLTLPKQAFCVGNRTATAAKAAGLEPVSADGDAHALIELIRDHHPTGLVLHICGEHIRGDVAKTLSESGIQAKTCVLYGQAEHPLSQDAIALLQGEDPVLVPLFSPRSAALFSKQLAALDHSAPITYAVLSKAVGEALPPSAGQKLCYAERPTAESLVKAIAGVYAAS